jgi:hypothetical protein
MKRISILITLILLVAAFTPGVSSAQGVAGTYQYVQQGYSGTMTIRQMGPGYVFTFNTTSKSNGQMCDFQTYETPVHQGGGRIDDDLPAHGGTADDGIKFTISFTGNTATVDVESKGEECGMSGYFGGNYVKVQ